MRVDAKKRNVQFKYRFQIRLKLGLDYLEILI